MYAEENRVNFLLSLLICMDYNKQKALKRTFSHPW